jgi:hypothetical protein
MGAGSGDGMISIESVILCGESKPFRRNPGNGSFIQNLHFTSSHALPYQGDNVLFAILDHNEVTLKLF